MDVCCLRGQTSLTTEREKELGACLGELPEFGETEAEIRPQR